MTGAPLCDAGRCAQLLAGLAEARSRLIAGYGDRVAEVMGAVLADPELGLSVEQRARVPAVLARHVDALGDAA